MNPFNYTYFGSGIDKTEREKQEILISCIIIKRYLYQTCHNNWRLFAVIHTRWNISDIYVYCCVYWWSRI